MSVQLLDKTRKINKLLHNNNSSKVVFNDICEVLSDILGSNVLVISKKGKVLGISLCPEVEEIKELIDEVKQSYSNLATADQADSLSDDLTKAKAAIQKLATAEQLDATQGKVLGIVEQEMQATAEIRDALPRITADMEQRSRAFIETQNANTARLEKLMTEMSAAFARGKAEQLQDFASKLEALSQSLGSQMDKLSSEADSVLAVAENNRVLLTCITSYLSLPGYKRLFKGMEVPSSEAAQ